MSTAISPFRSQVRALTDHAVTGLAILATLLVITPLVAIFGYLILQRRGLAQLGILHPDSQAGG